MNKISKDSSERIICFPSSLLDNKYKNFTGVFKNEFLWQRIKNNLITLPRNTVEHDPSYRQIVVYVLVRFKNQYLVYQRTKITKEDRLQEMYSIGIGGHVNNSDNLHTQLFSDNSFDSFLSNAIFREVHEEIRIESNRTREPVFIGFLLDNTNDVGMVHFGVVSVIEIFDKKVFSKKEKGVGNLKFQNLSSLQNNSEKLESWSILIVKYLSRRGK